MKKYVFMLVAAGSIGFTASAQMKASLGPNAGFGGAWLSNFTGNKFKPSGNIGLALIYSGKSNFGFGADLKYSFEGVKSETTMSGIKSEYDIDLDYIRVPLKAMFFFGKYGQRLRPKVTVGPTLGFLVGGNRRRKITSSNGTFTEDVVQKSTDIFKSFDLGLNASAGINYRLVKNTWFSADVAYVHGLMDVRKDKGGDTRNYMNRNLGLNLGVYFGL
jgi:opacity protein-like surface antigen